MTPPRATKNFNSLYFWFYLTYKTFLYLDRRIVFINTMNKHNKKGLFFSAPHRYVFIHMIKNN